jgi:hypothetical protein
VIRLTDLATLFGTQNLGLRDLSGCLFFFPCYSFECGHCLLLKHRATSDVHVKLAQAE